jgi:hypothetical protein
MNQIIAYVTYDVLNNVSSQNIFGLLEWAENKLLGYDLPEIYVKLEKISIIAAYLKQSIKNLKDLKKEEKIRVRKKILKIIDFSFARIAEVVKNHIEFAERFIRDEWIPMLKEVAIDKLTENHSELEQLYNNWDVANEKIVIRLLEGARAYEEMAQGLEDGIYDSIEVNGQEVTRNSVNHLRNAAQFMKDEAEMRMDPVRAIEIKEQLKEAIDIYDTVRSDIEDDEYDPLDYSKPVYVEARRRLGISEFSEFTTVSMVLGGREVAKENPFLARAIVAWRWKKGVERTIYTGALMASLGILTIAALVAPMVAVAAMAATGGLAGLILTATDIGIGLVMGIKGIADANELLNMARLDIRQDIRGISIEDAEKALKHAWIGFGVTIVLTAGVGALRTRAAFKARGGRVIRPTSLTRAPKRTQPERHRLFETTATTGESTLPPGAGQTDKFGNIRYSTQGTQTQQSLALYHEKVHSFLSPKMRFFRNWRADIGMTGYRKSSFLKYLEEALAETYAQLRVHGLRGLPDGIMFPVKNGYVTVSRVLGELAVGTIVIGGITYGVYVVVSEK